MVDNTRAENPSHDRGVGIGGQSFREGGVRGRGTAIAEILPPMGLFGGAGARRAEKKKSVTARLKEFFDRFYDISGGEFYRPD